jgi:hypothetical protein
MADGLPFAIRNVLRRQFNAQVAWGLLILAMLILPSGCRRTDGVVRIRVRGQVTLNGNPVRDGAISFVPADGKGPTAGAKIVAGLYTAEVPIGSKRVEIISPKVIGQRAAYDGAADSPMMDIVEEQIPLKYNVESILKAEVSHEKRTADFNLTTQ